MKLKPAGFKVLPLLLILVASGCSSVNNPATSEQPIPAIEENTAAAAGKMAADALPCPQDVKGMQFFAEEAHGFCVLIPDGFDITRPDDSEVAAFIGPKSESGLVPLGYIVVTDAKGKSAAEIAAPAIAEAKNMGLAVEQKDIILGGEKAVMVDGLPGQDVTRKIFVVHGGTEYEISFTPADPKLDVYASVESLTDAVTGSFAFLR
jgi:hypothetical protein